jgi:TolB-like protein/class 3 adenylate cyclase
VERRLAAILAADVVGYSRLVGADEAGTIARLRALRKEFIEPTVGEYRGRVVKLVGDGALVEFASAVDAVECAVAIQNGVAERQAGEREDRRIAFRIGINLGDIIVEDGDILGDGVNVAARLEGLAEPGGIWVARNVHNQVEAKLDLAFEPMGDHRVKNIAKPIAVYRVCPGPRSAAAMGPGALAWALRGHRLAAIGAAAVAVLLVAGAGGAAWYALWRPSAPPPATVAQGAGGGPAKTKPALPLPDKPSIVVLPFRNLSGEAEQAYFADAITEDIVTGLARFRHLFVISSNSSFRYKGQTVDIKEVGRELGVRFALQGSVRRSEDRLRITVQLIDATKDEQLWGEIYDRDLTATDLFAVQDAITQQVLATLGGVHGMLAGSVSGIAKTKPTDNLEAYELYFLGTKSIENEMTRDGHEKWKNFIERRSTKTLPLRCHIWGLAG